MSIVSEQQMPIYLAMRVHTGKLKVRGELTATLTNLPTLLRLATSRAHCDTDRRSSTGCAEEFDNPLKVAEGATQSRTLDAEIRNERGV